MVLCREKRPFFQLEEKIKGIARQNTLLILVDKEELI